MTDALESLTEKEKEALRLLLAGHDAKSSARELGLSHYTVNDRLRSARRKLSVNTSREAARLLGEAENTIPNPLVHSPLGDASANGPSNYSISASDDHTTRRRGIVGKGLIVMSVTAALILIATTFASNGAEDSAAPAQTTPVATGLEARIESADSLDEARAFLALLDDGDAQASYDRTAGELRDNQGFELWQLGVALRKNRGDFSSRKIVGAGGRDGEPKPGDWDREVFIFQSEHDDRTLTEYIVTQKFGTDWKIIKYDLKGLDDDVS